MYLNNKGWGLKEMILLSCVILVAVFVAAIMINNLYKDLDMNINGNNTSNTSNSSQNKDEKYATIERNLLGAARKYARENELEDEEIIDSDTLIDEGYLTLSKMTNEDDTCEGYVTKQNSSYKAYISCESYETKGY